MDVVLLGLLGEVTGLSFSMDHAAVHGNRLIKNSIHKLLGSRMPHSMNSAFRESQIDRLGKIERRD